MVDWGNPVVVAEQYTDFIKTDHVLAGVYIWELVTNLQHDLYLVRRKEERVGTAIVKWVYLACRYATLASVVTILVGFNVTSTINCKSWIISVFFFSFSAVQLASILIAIRVIAIWNKNKYLIGVVVAAICTQTAFFLHELIGADAAWIAAEQTCLVLHTETSRANVTVTLSVDFFLLVSMLVGLLRWKQAGHFGLWRFLWQQGLIWIALATVAEVPTVVFLWLNLNQVMNLMFFTPEMLILVIGATRMYRTLTNFTKYYDPSGASGGSGAVQSVQDATPMHRVRARQQDAETGAFSAVVPLEVGVHRTFEEHSSDKAPPSYGFNDKVADYNGAD